MGIKRLVMTSVAGVVLIGGAFGPLPGATDDPVSMGIPLGTVLEANGCMEPAMVPPVAQFPDWGSARLLGGDVPPARLVRDPFPTFHSVAVDPVNDVVVMTDSNRHGVLVYNRTAGSPDSPEITQPRNSFRGPSTGMMFVAMAALDPVRREIYTVDNDIGDRMMTYSYDADGNARPKRALSVPHQAWGLAISQARQEIAVTVESSRQVVIYKLGASGNDEPVRTIRGLKTGMGDPHGIFFDDQRNEIIVANHGNQRISEREAAEATKDGRPTSFGGRWIPPAITVLPSDADGDVAPLRTISGDATRIDWPMGLSVDPKRDEIAVANSGDDSILVFKRDASGNTAPIRVIQGSKTGLNGPMGVSFDPVNQELWVTNYGAHTALVFDSAAAGNIAPKRIVRNAPKGASTAGFGNPGAIAYDSKRKEIIVPN